MDRGDPDCGRFGSFKREKRKQEEKEKDKKGVFPKTE
jgi:hypothetical protein